MSENNNHNKDTWLAPLTRLIAVSAFLLVAIIFAVTVILTFSSHSCCYPKRFDPPQVAIVVDSTTVHVDSVAISAVQDSINVISQRQHDWYANYLSDLRQESNNNINKYNGWLSLWIALVTILLTLVPLYINYKSERHYKEKFDDEVSRFRKEYKDELDLRKKQVDKLEDKMDNLTSHFRQLHVQQSAISIGSIHAHKIFSDTSRRDNYWHSFLNDFQLNLRGFVDDYKDRHKDNRYLEDDLKPLREVLINIYYVLDLWSNSLTGKSQSKAIITLLGEIADMLAYTKPTPPEPWLFYYRNYVERTYSIIERVIVFIKEKV